MKIFLLSDTSNPRKDLKKRLSQLINDFGNEIAYISSTPQTLPYYWFNNSLNDYKAINSKINLTYFDLSEKFSDEQLLKIQQFRIIHLSGGNTFQFIDYIRKRNFGTIIEGFLQDKLIIGVSAGAIILTPTIKIACIEDENTIGLEELTGLSLVDFEFFPHFNGSKEQIEPLTKQENYNLRKIFYANDEEGVFVDEGKIMTFGGHFGSGTRLRILSNL